MTFVRRHTGSAPCLLSSCKCKIFILNKEEKSHLIIIKTFFIAFIVLHQRKRLYLSLIIKRICLI